MSEQDDVAAAVAHADQIYAVRTAVFNDDIKTAYLAGIAYARVGRTGGGWVKTSARDTLRLEGIQSSLLDIRQRYDAGERRGGVRYKLILDLAELAGLAPAPRGETATPNPGTVPTKEVMCNEPKGCSPTEAREGTTDATTPPSVTGAVSAGGETADPGICGGPLGPDAKSDYIASACGKCLATPSPRRRDGEGRKATRRIIKSGSWLGRRRLTE